MFLCQHGSPISDTKKARIGSSAKWRLVTQGKLKFAFPDHSPQSLTRCRFFVHKSIAALGTAIVDEYARPGVQAMLFPTPKAARRCMDFIRQRADEQAGTNVGVIDLGLDASKEVSPQLIQLAPAISATIFPKELFPLAKQYWQHTGDGVSSRRAEFFHELLRNGLINIVSAKRDSLSKRQRGPRRYQAESIEKVTADVSEKKPVDEALESLKFLEERFGRNLDLSLVESARSAICRRIAGTVTDEESHSPIQPVNGGCSKRISEGDVYLFPAGMNAIYNAHRFLLDARGQLKSVNFGFPYVDTLKILQKFGPGCHFYGFASEDDLDKLEALLRGGEKLLALFCEFPGNPLLVSPNLQRIRKLADEFDFAVVVDETIGTFVNVNVLQYADIVVSSLTKIFSGDSNVMGGCAILNSEGKYYESLKASVAKVYEDTYWAEDVIFMERNSRDFLARVERINTNAEIICDILSQHPLTKTIYYPKFNPSKANYDACKRLGGGYGGLLSVVFQEEHQAQAFYDAMEIAKGPSLGTNFTLCSPYVLLAHYTELSWAAEFGVEASLVRLSVGLEDGETLRRTLGKGLQAAESSRSP